MDIVQGQRSEKNRLHIKFRLLFLTAVVICILTGNVYAGQNVKLTDEQIQKLKENLRIPDNIVVTDYSAEAPTYWEGAGLWTMQVDLYSYGQLVGGAGVDPNTMEPMRNIYTYEPPAGGSQEGTNLHHEAIIQEIKDLYYDTEDRMSEFTHVTDDAGFTWYFYGKGLKKIHVPAGAYDKYEYEGTDRYSADYYYDTTCTVRFVFVYDGTEEHRYYIDGVNGVGCIRYIDDAGYVYNYYQKEDLSDVPGPNYFCSMALMEPHWAGLV